MTEARKKPAMVFWANVALVVALVGYPLSFGPACWINIRVRVETAPSVYQPLLLVLKQNDEVRDLFEAYAMIGSPKSGVWRLLDSKPDFVWIWR